MDSVITILVVFDEIVTVDTAGGVPLLQLTTGPTNRSASYVSGSGSNTLTFSYTVQSGDVSNDLDYTSLNALVLSGGLILDPGSAPAVLTLPAVGGASSIAGQSNVVVDGVMPTVTVLVADNSLTVGESSQVTITFSEAVIGFDNDDIAVGNGTLSPVTSSDNITWTATLTPTAGLTSPVNLVVVDANGVTDAAGNPGALAGISNSYAIDGERPTATIAVDNSSLGLGETTKVTIAFSEVVTGFDLTRLAVTNGTLLNLATADGGKTYTATLRPSGNIVDATNTIDLKTPGILDVAGNAMNSTAVSNNYAVDTSPPPLPPVTIDGVSVQTVMTLNGDGSTTATKTIAPVAVGRVEDVTTAHTALADIELVRSLSGPSILEVGLPTGVGLVSTGLANRTIDVSALAELGLRINSIGNADMANDGKSFYNALPASEPLTVRVLTLSKGAGFDLNMPIVLNAGSDGVVAVALDARAMSAGAAVTAGRVDFLAVAGAVKILGGTGKSSISGDGADQVFVLGSSGNVVHAGGGNDTISSQDGDDRLYGGAGDDVISAGAGNDILSGGSGNDRFDGGAGFDVALQEGKLADYKVTLDGQGIRLTHISSGVYDLLVDVEQVRFDTGPAFTVAYSAAEQAAAFLFRKWLDRDMTQAEGVTYKALVGASALDVAATFARAFPQATSGESAGTLIDGMAESTSIIRLGAGPAPELSILGNAGDNTLSPVLGVIRHVDGYGGIDTVVLPVALGQAQLEASGTGFTLTRVSDGALLGLKNVERVKFSDASLALDVAGAGHAGQAVKLLGALGGPTLLMNKLLVGEVIRALDAGVSAESLAGLGLGALGAQTPEQVVQLLWTNLMGRAGTAQEIAPLVDLFDQGVTGAQLSVLAGDLDLNAVRIGLVGLVGHGVEYL